MSSLPARTPAYPQALHALQALHAPRPMHRLSNLEFIYYQLLRPKVLTEFAGVYAQRCSHYIANLTRAGHADLVGETDGLIHSNWR